MPPVPHTDSCRAAVIDIGSNSTRLLIADVVGEQVTVRERHSQVTRLGRGVDHGGQLSGEAIEAVCQTIDRYTALISEHQAERQAVIATSAVRDAGNGDAFIAELRERFALDAQVIDGRREADLTYAGVSAGREGDGLLAADIGGGSTEVIIGSGGRPEFSTSLQIGVVRHTERFLTGDPPSATDLERLAGNVAELIREAVAGHRLPPVRHGVAVAGTPSATAAMDLKLEPYDPEQVEGHRLDLETIQWWLSRLASMPLAERKQVPGLHPDRAQAIVAGLVILIELMRTFELEAVEVSERDILYGTAIRLAEGEFNRSV